MSRGASYLVATLSTLAALAMVLVLLTVEARVARRRTERAATAVRSRWRALLVEVASGEGQGGQERQALAQVSPEEWERPAPAVLAMLGKVRGRQRVWGTMTRSGFTTAAAGAGAARERRDAPSGDMP